MEQYCSIPISSVIATLLLKNRFVAAKDIVNFESKIVSECNDIIVDIYDDDINYLLVCVDVDNNMNFKIKDIFNYDSLIDGGVTVREFLFQNSMPNEIKKLIFDDIDLGNSVFFNKIISKNSEKRKVRVPWGIKKA